MLFRVAGGSRDHGSADHLHTVMRAEAAGKEAVAVGDRENVIPANAVGGQAAGHTFAPYTNIFAGISHDGRITSGAG